MINIKRISWSGSEPRTWQHEYKRSDTDRKNCLESDWEPPIGRVVLEEEEAKVKPDRKCDTTDGEHAFEHYHLASIVSIGAFSDPHRNSRFRFISEAIDDIVADAPVKAPTPRPVMMRAAMSCPRLKDEA